MFALTLSSFSNIEFSDREVLRVQMGRMGQTGHKRLYQSRIELVVGGSFTAILDSGILN